MLSLSIDRRKERQNNSLYVYRLIDKHNDTLCLEKHPLFFNECLSFTPVALRDIDGKTL